MQLNARSQHSIQCSVIVSPAPLNVAAMNIIMSTYTAVDSMLPLSITSGWTTGKVSPRFGLATLLSNAITAIFSIVGVIEWYSQHCSTQSFTIDNASFKINSLKKMDSCFDRKGSLSFWVTQACTVCLDKPGLTGKMLSEFRQSTMLFVFGKSKGACPKSLWKN